MQYDMYKVIINGKTKYASLEEAQKLIEDYGKRNHLYSLLDETWKIHDTIYLTRHEQEIPHFYKWRDELR